MHIVTEELLERDLSTITITDDYYLETSCVTLESIMYLTSAAIHHHYNFTRSESLRRKVLEM